MAQTHFRGFPSYTERLGYTITHADCTSRSRGPLRRRLPYPRQRQQRHVTYGDRGRSQSRKILDDVAKDLAIPWRAWQSTAKSVAGAGLKRRRGLAAAVTSRFPTACGVALLGGRRRRAEIRPAGYGRCRDPVGQAPGRRVGWLAGWRGGAQPTHRDTKKKKEKKIAPLMRRAVSGVTDAVNAADGSYTYARTCAGTGAAPAGPLADAADGVTTAPTRQRGQTRRRGSSDVL